MPVRRRAYTSGSRRLERAESKGRRLERAYRRLDGGRDLEAVRASGEKLQIRVLELASIADDVGPELALATIDSIVVLGAFRARPAVKSALAGRIRSS